MFVVIDNQAHKKTKEVLAEQFRKASEDAAKKFEAREQHIKATTCPHCGKHDPVPPWLL
ncbi:MAG: hypothetical protein K2X38_08710 [Gemmataceae bacterium]|nr:hypothetical protein [Gemmataceae bacterium]